MHIFVIVVSLLSCGMFLTSAAIPVPSDTVGQLLASRNVTTSSDVQRRDTSVYSTTQLFPRHDSVPAEDYFLGAKVVTNILDALDPPLSYVFVGELDRALLNQQFQGPFTALNIRVSSIDLKRTERALDKEETWKYPVSFTLKRKDTAIILTREGKDVHIPLHIEGAEHKLHTMLRQGPPIAPLMMATTTYLFPVPSIPLPVEEYLLAALAVARTLDARGIFHGFAKELKNGSPSLTLVVSRDHRKLAIDALVSGFSFSNPVNFWGILSGSVLMLFHNAITLQRPKYALRIPIQVEEKENRFGVTREPVGPPMGSPPHIYEFPIVSQ